MLRFGPFSSGNDIITAPGWSAHGERMAIRAVIFDHDGTLVDSYEGISRCFNLTCRDLGKPEMNREEVRASIGPTLEDRFTQLWGENLGVKAAEIYRGHYEAHFLSGTRLLPGVADTLDAIAELGLPMACVSNKTWNYCVRQLEHFGLKEKFDTVIGFKEGFPPKPDPAMILAALERIGVGPGEAAMVGDTPIDGEAARAAGVQTWAVMGDYATREDLEKSRPDKIFGKITNLLEFL